LNFFFTGTLGRHQPPFLLGHEERLRSFRGEECNANATERASHMAIPTAVNGQITDAVTQTNVSVLGDSPALSLGNLYQVSAHAAGMAMQNAVAFQQQMNITAQAATTVAVTILLGPGNGHIPSEAMH
jgi:hypothetical protein